MYVFDTNILIEFLRGKLPDAYQMLKNTDSGLVLIPSIVRMELLVGAEKSRNPEESRRAVDSLISCYSIVPFDSLSAAIAARIRADLERKGKKIGNNDYLVAATALAHDATLVTNNVDEFKRIPGLRILSLGEVELS